MKILQLLKKKKWIIPVASLLLSVIVGTVVIFTYDRNDEPLAPPSNSMSICLTPPSEGNPNDYSGLDNIGYIAGKLRSQPYFHSESKGSVNTMVTQDFLGYKDYKDGKLIASTISIAHSNLAPSNAIQKFFSDGKVVIRRAQSDNPSDWDGDNTVWATGAPSEVLDENAYIMRYGLPATELTEFIINAESLISCTTPVKGEDGVYTMTAKLDNEKSTYYYRMQMKTMGGLNSYPSFQNIEITFRFQEDWTLLSMDVHEEYETYVSVITAACVADTSVVFSYEEEKVDVSPYEDYFKEYANADTTETVEPERTATTYLASGFGPLINGQKCLSFTASVGENSFDGLIDLDMSLVPAMELKGLQLNVGGLVAGLKGEDIVVHYKDFTGKLALDELTALFASGGNDSGSADGGVSLDTEALLDGIMNAPIVRENGKAIIAAELDVAGMPISICFTFDDGEEVQLEKVEAALTLMDIPVKLEAQLCDKSAFPNVSFGAAVDLAPYVEDVKAFIENKAFAVDITYGNAGDELQVVGSAVLNIKDGLSAYVSAQVTYAGATLPVELTFVDNTVYVAANGIRLQGTVDEIKALVNEILPLVSKDGAQSMDELLPAMPEIKVEQILGAVFAVSFDEILTTLSVSDESLNITVDGDKLLTVLKDLVGDINFELGDITLGYDRASGALTASVLGANVTLTSTTDRVSAPENAADYIDLGTVTGYIPEIVELINSKAFALDVTYGQVGDELQVVGSAVLNIKDGLSAYVSAQVTYAGATLPVELTFVDNTVYVAANGIRLQGTVDEIKALVNEILPLVSKDGAQSMDELLPAMPEIKVEQILGAVFAVSFDEILTTLSVSDESLNITVDGDKLLSVLADLVGEIDLELGDIALGYDRASGALTASVLGANVTLTSTTDSVSAPENAADYIDLGTVMGYVPEIVELINSKAFAVEIAYGNAGDELQVVGSAVLNIKDGLSAYVSAQVTYAGATLPVELTFVDNTVYVSANGIRLQGTVDEIKALVNEILPLVSKDGAQSVDELLPAMPEIKVEQILGAVFAVSFDEILTTLSVSDESLNITVDGDKLLTVLKDLVGDINFELGDITLGYDRASGAVTASVLGANVTLTSTTDSVSAPENVADYIDLGTVTGYVPEIVELINSKAFALDVTYGQVGDELQVVGSAVLNIKDGLSAYVRAQVTYAGATLPVELTFVDNTVYVSANGIRLQGTVDEIKTLVNEILPLVSKDGAQSMDELLPAMPEIKVEQILGAVFAVSFDEILTTLSVSDESLNITVVDGDKLLTVLKDLVGDISFELGDITLGYDRASGTVTASVLGANVTLTSTTDSVSAPENVADYIDLGTVTGYIPEIVELIDSKAFALDITYGQVGDELQVVGSAVLNIQDGLSAYVSAQVTYAGATLPVELTFVDNTVYVSANGIRLQGTVDEIKALVNEILPLVSKDGAQSIDELLPAMPEIKVEQILGAVFAVSFDEILTTLSVSDESLNITVDGDKLLAVLADLVGEIDFDLGNITLGYDRASGTVTASVLGANVTLTSTTDSVNIPDGAADYIDLGTVTDYVPEIVELINSKAFAVEIAYGNAGDELQVVGSAVLNIKDGLSAYVSAQVTYAGATLPVELTFVDSTVYVAANGIRLQGTVDEIKALVNEILPLVSKDGAQSVDELLPAMPEIKVEQILGAVFAVSFDEILTTLSVSDESLNITVDGDKLLTVLKDLVGDINFELGDITLGYDRASGTVTASVLGANVTLTSTTDSVNAPSDTADFVSLADVTPIVHSVVEALTAENLAFNAALSTTVEGLDIGVDVEGYVTLGEQIGVYAKVNLSIFGGVETLEILYKDGGLTVVYGGVALQVTKDDVNIIVEQIVEIFGGDSESGEAQPLTDTEGTIDIIGLVNAIALTSETDGEQTKLRLTAALAGIFGAETVSDLDATLFVSGGRMRVETSALTVSGITLENVALGIGAVETVTEPDFSSVPVCKNVLEFLLAAYRELADSEYASLDFGFKTNEMNVSLNGLVQFASKENSTASIINVDAKAEIETFKWDDAASAYVSSGTHYIHLTILEEQLWASYSLKGMDADTAVYVTLPISELFVAGQTVLPLMAPMLGISEDIYYYDFIVKILDGKYPTINTDIIDMMTLEEWIALVLRAIEAEGVALAAEEVESSNTAVQPTVSFGESAEGNTTIAVDAGEMSATITMLTNGAAAITVPTNKTYIDISTIATLLTDVLHAYDYAKNYNGYALSGNLAIGVGKLDLKNIGVNLQIKTDDGISIAAKITPKSGTTTYLTVKDGMFYITRTVKKDNLFSADTLTTEHRAMTAEQFLGDMMQQIYFILNLSDLEIWIVDGAINSSTPPEGPSEYDAGEMVNNYTFTPESGADKATYKIGLNLGAIMNNSAFGAVNATITREKISGKEYYDLTSISATVGISVLTASVNLTHDGAKDVNNIKPQTVAEYVATVVAGLGYSDEAAVKEATAGGMLSKSTTVKI